ncbi:hypothetical protein K9N68_34975 (plasmid) [Kovacikia minuta CCNUW1]|uniref:hypothetical protein n=1 Tax=Kovacikia minuta TaxID=2931930 RepID=UPI001CCB84AF|nr:hypothetical protein [Kovacikia minuta]UBF30404.1 hypothetical protein K9N68_34975 [Kovacikia minuta CCNUW1]
MARAVNRKCLHCALQLVADEARRVHGSEGDGCWQESVCHRRRSHYRNRHRNNEKRRQERRLNSKTARSSNSGQLIEITLPEPESLAAFLIFVRRNLRSPVHAIGAEVWQQGQMVGKIQLRHTAGMRSTDLTAYLQQMQQQLHESFGIERFEDTFVEIQPEDCPLDPCPLRPTRAG